MQATEVVVLSIRPYSGRTFVAFLDVSGFKKMMENERKAERALGKFYSTIYSVGQDFQAINRDDLIEVNAIVVSDCAILFSRIGNTGISSQQISNNILGLRSILTFIKSVNHRLITTRSGVNESIMTTCSIAYGDFKYENRIGLYQVRKNYFLGKAYVNAFFDNEIGEPKIQPGQCRLLKDNWNLPSEFPDNSIFSLLELTEGYYYFHWMLSSLEDLPGFRDKYGKIVQGVYPKLSKLIREYATRAR